MPHHLILVCYMYSYNCKSSLDNTIWWYSTLTETLNHIIPVCVFCSGAHRRVLPKVRHPAGETKVNQVLLDQILVPVQLEVRQDICFGKNWPNPSGVDTVAVCRDFHNVHCSNREVTVVLLKLEIKKMFIGINPRSTCEPFSNFSQLSSWTGKIDNLWEQKERTKNSRQLPRRRHLLQH